MLMLLPDRLRSHRRRIVIGSDPSYEIERHDGKWRSIDIGLFRERDHQLRVFGFNVAFFLVFAAN